MLDIKQVRKDLNTVVEALQKKGFTFPVEEFQELDSRRKAADMASQQLLAERKKASKLIGSLIAQGKSVDEAKAEVMKHSIDYQQSSIRQLKRHDRFRPHLMSS